jgi:hypothetical protein
MKIGRAAPSPPPSPPAPAHGAPRTFLEVLGEGSPRPSRPTPPAGPPTATAAPNSPSTPSPLVRGLTRALAGAAAGEARLDAILDAAARGKTFTATEMLAMQATVFRYSQTVEVLSRATDRLVGAVKQTLGTQV